MHPLVKLARETIESYVRDERIPNAPAPLPEEMEIAAGAFVSLHDSRGNLRGCIGTIEPTHSNVAEEVIHNAVAAATRDPRFPPIQPAELEGLDVKVDVLTPAEPIAGPEELDVKRYGVIVQSGWRRGLLLPDLEGVDSVEMQIDIARQKAGIGPDEEYDLYRFEVKRYV